MNKLLLRQIDKYIKAGDDVPENVKALLNVISESYDHYEKDRKMLERSIELSSMEMIELNNRLRKETEEGNKAVYNSIKESLAILNDTQEETSISDFDFHKLSQIANILKEETKKRRKAEQEKTKHATHLETSQKIAHIGSWEFDLINLDDLNNNTTYWSEESYRIFGFEPGSVEAGYNIFFTRVHPEDIPLIEDAVKKSIETGEAYDIEHRIVLPDGTEKIVHERSDIIFDSTTNKPIKMIGTVQDITERKKADQQLKKANNELRTLFENMLEAYFIVDMKKYQITQISPSCKDIYGYADTEFYQNPNLWIEVVLEEDKQIIWAKDAEMRRGISIINTYRIHHKQGDIKWLETKITPTLNKQGELIRIDGVTSDITEKIKAEQALKDNEYRFRTFIENSSDAIVVIDEKFNIIFASESIYRVSGFKPEDIIGEPNTNFVYYDDILLAESFFKDILANPGQVKTALYRINKKNGEIIWTERIGINLIDDPVIKGIVINFRDITKRKEYEDALKASNEDLKKSNSELDRFVYSVSHDLRAPLSSMLGIIGLIEVETTDKNIADDIQLVKRNVHKLDGFIADILEYSRNSRLEVKKEEINFKDLLNDVKNNLKYMASAASDVDIQIKINDQDVFYSDTSRLIIILNNLISNAVRYSNPKTDNPFVEVNIQCYSDKAIIVIKDNGIGISVENQPKVFDMFYRISKKSVGSGLGLYIVKEAVEKLSGVIQIESEFDIGTTFTVIVPNQKNNN